MTDVAPERTNIPVTAKLGESQVYTTSDVKKTCSQEKGKDLDECNYVHEAQRPLR